MALRAGYYGLKTKILNKVNKWDQIVFTKQDQMKLGARNLLLNTANSETRNGLIFTVNSDKSVTISGTATANTNYYFNRSIDLKPGDYVLSGMFAGDASTNRILLSYVSGGSTVYVTNANGQKLFTLPNDATNIQCQIAISNGKTVDETIKPMIRYADDKDNEYTEGALSNIVLSNSAANQKTAINAIITAATSAADFAAFKTAMGAITPVTRSLNRTASPEDVPEEVIEEEKTVTKKTTRKTTAKEGE